MFNPEHTAAVPGAPPGWDPGVCMVLLGGHSAAGKTRLSQDLGRRLGMPWMQADDIRLAFARTLLDRGLEIHRDMCFFEYERDVWRTHTPEALCEALIAAGEAFRTPLEAVIVNHVGHGHPTILEGDGILPSLWTSPVVAERAGALRAAFLVEPDEEAILANILRRGRNLHGYSDRELRASARTKWLFGDWIAREAARFGLPVVAPRPFATLAERVERRLHA